jgi:hypothetical protein
MKYKAIISANLYLLNNLQRLLIIVLFPIDFDETETAYILEGYIIVIPAWMLESSAKDGITLNRTFATLSL